MRPDPVWVLTAYHCAVGDGQLCPTSGRCPGRAGDVVIVVELRSVSAAQMEALVTRKRVDNPADHLGSFTVSGPGYIEQYPEREGNRS